MHTYIYVGYQYIRRTYFEYNRQNKHKTIKISNITIILNFIYDILSCIRENVENQYSYYVKNSQGTLALIDIAEQFRLALTICIY